MSTFNRRDFLKTAAAAAASLATGGSVLNASPGAASSAPAKPARRSATDWVPLGNSGVQVTRPPSARAAPPTADRRATGAGDHR